MPILNYTTEIAVEKTMGEVTKALARRSVTRISTLFDDDGNPAGLAFTMKTPYGAREYELPVRTSGVLRAMQADGKVPKSKQTPEQAARVAWRIAKDWLEAQAALIGHRGGMSAMAYPGDEVDLGRIHQALDASAPLPGTPGLAIVPADLPALVREAIVELGWRRDQSDAS